MIVAAVTESPADRSTLSSQTRTRFAPAKNDVRCVDAGADGTQKNVIVLMQMRDELYERVGYHDYEQRLDALFAARK